MGNDGNVFRVTNAMPSGMLIAVGSVKELVVKTKKVDWSIKGGAHGSIGAKVKTKGKDVQSDIGKELKLDVEGYYKNQTQYAPQSVSWEERIPPGTPQQIKLTKDANYFSVFHVVDGSKFTIFLNRGTQNFKWAGYVIYMLNGYPKVGQMLSGNWFRMKRNNCGDSHARNYPPGYTCNQCHEGPENCNPKCKRYKDSY